MRGTLLALASLMFATPGLAGGPECYQVKLVANLDALNSGNSGKGDRSTDLEGFLGALGNMYFFVELNGNLQYRVSFENVSELLKSKDVGRFCYRVQEDQSTYFQDTVCESRFLLRLQDGENDRVRLAAYESDVANADDLLAEQEFRMRRISGMGYHVLERQNYPRLSSLTPNGRMYHRERVSVEVWPVGC
jgi:hypothetical protein